MTIEEYLSRRMRVALGYLDSGDSVTGRAVLVEALENIALPEDHPARALLGFPRKGQGKYVTIRWQNASMPWEVKDGVVEIPADVPSLDGTADYIAHLEAEELETD